MFMRGQVGGDQLMLLARGWLFVQNGVPFPYGAGMSGGGFEPGSFTNCIIGLPLFFWQHCRAPVVLILLSHLASYLIVDRILVEIFSRRIRPVLLLLYWLNP